MADKKVSDLTALTQADSEDLLLIVSDPVGAPASRKITVSDFFSNVSVVSTHTANVAFEGQVTFSSSPTFVSETDITRLNANTIVTDNVIINNTLTSNGSFNANSATIDNLTVTGNTTFSGNTSFTANLHSTGTTTISNLKVLNNTFTVNDKYGDPSSANAANEGVTAGAIFFSDEYLYVAIDENTLKRVALSTFSI